MKKLVTRISVLVITAGVAVVVIMVMVARAQGPETKPYAEGQGAQATGRVENPTSQEMRPGEGLSGSSGTGRLSETGAADLLATNGLSVLYRFSGVADDGAQGSASRKIATSVHCTNIDNLNTAQVEVQVFDFSGTEVYTATMSLSPNRTKTASTQGTAVYFEDALLGGLPGTGTINQGSGRILSSNTNVICTAQVLDPLNVPPVFMSALEMFRQ